MLARSPSSFGQDSPPAFVAEWLVKREARAAQKSTPPDPVQVEKTVRAAQKRAAEKRQRWADGLDEMSRWLEDLAEEGAVSRNIRNIEVWDDRARRLNDAQLPGLAREARRLGSSLLAHADWMPVLATGVGRLHLAIRAHRSRMAQAPRMEQANLLSWTPGMHADLDRYFGLPQREADIPQEAHVIDTWCCLGEVVEQEDRLTARRTWWQGQATGRLALVWSYAAPGGPGLPPSSRPPLAHALTLGYFPSEEPLRAAILAADWSPSHVAPPAGSTIEDALDAACTRAAADPWALPLPMLVRGRLGSVGNGWWIGDETGAALEVASPFDPFIWLARTEGKTSTWFCEWDGSYLRPLSVWSAPVQAVEPGEPFASATLVAAAGSSA